MKFIYCLPKFHISENQLSEFIDYMRKLQTGNKKNGKKEPSIPSITGLPDFTFFRCELTEKGEKLKIVTVIFDRMITCTSTGDFNNVWLKNNTGIEQIFCEKLKQKEKTSLLKYFSKISQN